MLTSKVEHFINNTVNSTEDEIIILESQLSGHPESLKTFVAAGTKRSISVKSNRIVQMINSNTKTFSMNPWEALKKFKAESNGWLFGYLGYDLKNHTEELSSKNNELLAVADMFFMEPKVLLVIENGNTEFAFGKHHFYNILSKKQKSIKYKSKVTYKRTVNKKTYTQTVQKIKKRIKEGDFYELNYTYPLKGRIEGSAFGLYTMMKEINPVPFGAFLRNRDVSVACISPERFLKRIGQTVISEPIKGTSKRANDPHVDSLLKKELLSEKNRAENLMIVDLVRHDMSKIAVPGSVQVTNLYDLHSFETVHQLVSSIECKVKTGTDSVDIIRECFPMGSMTGAPKIEVMKQIEQFENYKRGIYSGAIGYFDPDDNFDFNVVIRSAIIQGNHLVYPVGGAITSDSDPEAEWEETKIKSKTLTQLFSSNKK